MTPPGFIDVHAHHYPSVYVEACLGPGSPYSASRLATGRIVVRDGDGIVLTIPTDLPDPVQRLEEMTAAGIGVQLLSVPSPSVYGFPPAEAAALAREVNKELVQYAERGGERLRVLLTVPLPSPEAVVEEFEEWEGHPLVSGALICSHIRGLELDDPSLIPFWEYVEYHQPTILVHPTSPICSDGYELNGLSIAAGFMHEQSRSLARLCFSPVVQERPHALDRLILSHLGGGIASLGERLDVYWARFIEPEDPQFPRPTETLRRPHFDLALNSRPAMLAAIEAFGTEKLMLGTDHPHMPYGMTGVIEQVQGLSLAPDVLLSLLRGNAERLLSG